MPPWPVPTNLSGCPPPAWRSGCAQRAWPDPAPLRERALLDAAEELLLAHRSLENLTVEAIAKKAGVSRGSLYFYLGSRHQILAALVERTGRTTGRTPTTRPGGRRRVHLAREGSGAGCL
ncbi:helix-turn-helix domain-containing protein [Streptomyces tendae]|uniref:helix-turn-helix domain-containing protein n=1 Tax=Streptomyces tendae TaxID=1932 RepID=UPI003677D347